jgi:hypothetical protein
MLVSGEEAIDAPLAWPDMASAATWRSTGRA